MVTFLVGILVVAIILGALFGARSFGETVRTGCGVIILIFVIILITLFILHHIHIIPNGIIFK